jgi:hypothetical protein
MVGGIALLCSSLSTASSIFVIGTPSLNNNNTLSPRLGSVINFDDPATVTNVMTSGANFLQLANFYASPGAASISDPSGGVPSILSLRGASGSITTETVALPTSTQNPSHASYAFLDSRNDIFWPSIMQPADLTAKSPSRLAIDDLQLGTPEPANAALLITVALLFCFSLLRKRKRSN